MHVPDNALHLSWINFKTVRFLSETGTKTRPEIDRAVHGSTWFIHVPRWAEVLLTLFVHYSRYWEYIRVVIYTLHSHLFFYDILLQAGVICQSRSGMEGVCGEERVVKGGSHFIEASGDATNLRLRRRRRRRSRWWLVGLIYASAGPGGATQLC